MIAIKSLFRRDLIRILMVPRNRGMSSSITNSITTGGQVFSLFGNFNLKLFIYIIIAIIIEIGAIVYATSTPMYIAAILFVPISLYIFITYGINWFGPNGPYQNTIGPWPPTINSCPDFLTGVDAGTATNKMLGCIDTIGVSNGGNAKFLRIPSGQFSWATATTATAPVTGDTTGFSLGFFAIFPNEDLATTCSRLKTAGLTWEGVYDGMTCFKSNGSSALGNNGSGSC